jgi:hypothetical protein
VPYGLIAGAVVAAVVLLGGLTFLAVHLGSGSGSSSGSGDQAYAGPLRSPMQLRPVQAEQAGPCAAGRFPSLDGKTCYALGTGFTVTSVRGAQVKRTGQPTPVLSVSLGSADAARFTALTQQAYQAYQQDPNAPGGRIAVVVNGQVVMAPQIMNPITGGSFDIATGPSQTAQLEQLYRALTGR